MRFLIFAPILAAMPASALAKPLRFEEALASAATNGASVEAGRLEIEARRVAATAAGQWPDPKVGLSIENFPISGPPAFSLDGDSMTMGRVSLSQEVPSSAKRLARVGRATADIAEARATREVSLREAQVAAGVAWVDLASAQQRLSAVDFAIGKISAYRGAGVAGVASGTVRPAQTLETRTAIAQLEDARAEILAQRNQARARLTRWTGDADPAAVGPLPSPTLDPQALEQGIPSLPQIGLENARVQQARSDVSLAEADKRPDWMFDVAYEKRASRYGDMISAGVTVSLPLFPGRRQNPVIASRLASSQAAASRREDARRAIAEELKVSFADHVMHHDQWMRARDTLLPLARDRADLEVASYAAGRASIQDVVTARIAAVEAQLLVLEREAAVTRDAVRINLTFGGAER
ncbi:TolC family protein [Parablastomonas sp. CN1-191]|uniref:TolC family protein n=1 Tax=Parablastomonas sp. CN1-191 TaxID=3400908 RepID=UPI003BF8D283